MSVHSKFSRPCIECKKYASSNNPLFSLQCTCATRQYPVHRSCLNKRQMHSIPFVLKCKGCNTRWGYFLWWLYSRELSRLEDTGPLRSLEAQSRSRLYFDPSTGETTREIASTEGMLTTFAKASQDVLEFLSDVLFEYGEQNSQTQTRPRQTELYPDRKHDGIIKKNRKVRFNSALIRELLLKRAGANENSQVVEAFLVAVWRRSAPLTLPAAMLEYPADLRDQLRTDKEVLDEGLRNPSAFYAGGQRVPAAWKAIHGTVVENMCRYRVELGTTRIDAIERHIQRDKEMLTFSNRQVKEKAKECLTVLSRWSHAA